MVELTDYTAWTEERLLTAFVRAADEAAFASLVRRYGSMVWRVCHNVLGQAQNAEDAAQAVFLALARKAGALKTSRPLGPWLHHVAYCISVDVRRSRAARLERERKAVEMNSQACPSTSTGEDLTFVLTRELDGLPERYRQPLILFHLEERSLDQTALALGCPVGTVGVRLARGRELLRKRLAARGVSLSLLTLGGLLSAEAGAAVLPATFVSATSKAAVLFAAKGAAAAEGLSTTAAALAKGWLNTMLYAKLKLAAVALLAAGVVGTAAVFLLNGPGKEAKAEGSKAAADAASDKVLVKSITDTRDGSVSYYTNQAAGPGMTAPRTTTSSGTESSADIGVASTTGPGTGVRRATSADIGTRPEPEPGGAYGTAPAKYGTAPSKR